MEFYLYLEWYNMVNEVISYFSNRSDNTSHNSTTTTLSRMKIYYEDYARSDSRTTIIEPMLCQMLYFSPDQIVNTTIPQFVLESYNNENNHTNQDDDSHNRKNNSSHHYHDPSSSNDTNLIMTRRMYTPQQQMAIQRLAQVMTTPQTWSVLQHYFENIL